LKLPEELTELFYKVRFGDDIVDAATAQSLDDRLDRLESLIDTNRQRQHASKV
jgi:hypothetical protein